MNQAIDCSCQKWASGWMIKISHGPWENYKNTVFKNAMGVLASFP